jgi:phi13 family phage major tail protein
MDGYYTGVLDLYWAEMTTEDTATTAPVYGEPAVLGKTIEVTITPVTKEGKVYASNVATRNEDRIVGYDVSINPDAIDPETLATIVGRATESGVQLVKSGQTAPWVALGFAATRDDDTKEYWWLYKGKFGEPTRTAQTDSDSMNYQHPQLEGHFVQRADNSAIAAIADSTVTDAEAAIASWFSAVYTGGSTQGGSTQGGT